MPLERKLGTPRAGIWGVGFMMMSRGGALVSCNVTRDALNNLFDGKGGIRWSPANRHGRGRGDRLRFLHGATCNKSVSDATYKRALEKFGEQGIIDLTAANAYYTFNAMMLNVARTSLPAGAKVELQSFPH